jgi:hypothetical protein
MIRDILRFSRESDGGATVEFVAAMLFFVVIVFFTFEIAVAVFWNATAEKAAQLGARLAIVGNPAVTAAVCPSGNNDGDPVAAGTMPLRNCRTASAIYGTSCSIANTCQTWGPIECVGGSGGSCNAAGFATIAQRIRSIFGPATDETITIRYADSGLGYAGGPVIPLVTVEISGVEYDLIFAAILQRIGELATWQETGTNPATLLMPPVSATLTGEDLSV